MNDILFRGKRIYDGKWIYGNLVIDNSLESHIVPRDFFFEDGHHLVYDDETDSPVFVFKDSVGQYTGLTKNGKKIFEGDILCVRHRGKTGSRICPVYFGEYIDADSVFDNYRCIGFYIKTSDGCCTIGALLDEELDEEFEFEVIGNIFDNPELLEVEEHE